jgi:hypothetical protein
MGDVLLSGGRGGHPQAQIKSNHTKPSSKTRGSRLTLWAICTASRGESRKRPCFRSCATPGRREAYFLLLYRDDACRCCCSLPASVVNQRQLCDLAAAQSVFVYFGLVSWETMCDWLEGLDGVEPRAKARADNSLRLIQGSIHSRPRSSRLLAFFTATAQFPIGSERGQPQ